MFRHKNNVKRSILCTQKYKNNKIHNNNKYINQLKIIYIYIYIDYRQYTFI